MKKIIGVICLLMIGISILARYLLSPQINGPLWFIIVCEVVVIVGIIKNIRTLKK